MTSVNIAKSFSASIKKLSTPDRGRVLDFLTKFMEDPSSPGLNFETIEGAKDSFIKSARITQDLRTILHNRDGLHTLLYAAHHEEAYRWAERHRVERHRVTGTMQIIEAAETVDLPEPESTSQQGPRLFDDYDDEYLISLGVPDDWALPLRQVRDEDQLLSIVERLPEEVAERMIALASGEIVTPPAPVTAAIPIQQNPDNLRRFWVVEDAAELASVLERPIEDWVRFLHPSQRELVTADFKGPAKVSGAAGTGKTVVGMHRARALAAKGKRVLLTSFVTTLCRNIERNIHVLCAGSQKEFDGDVESRITVSTVHKQALTLARKINSGVQPADDSQIESLTSHHHATGGFLFDTGFLTAEWHGVIEPQGIQSWDEYRDASRTGRGKPLSVKQRKQCWNVFERVYEDLQNKQRHPWSSICRMAREGLETGVIASPFDAVIVDEVQDLQPQEVQLLAVLAAANPGNLMVLGDTGQRIYSGGFSLKKLGIDVRGRSQILRINYRTTEQIRRFADALLGDTSDDFNEGREDRRSHSLLKGPSPTLRGFKTEVLQNEFIVGEVQRALNEGLTPREVAIFARSGSHLKSVRQSLTEAGIPVYALSSDDDLDQSNGVNFGTMHRAKGLEFKVVFVVNCSDDVVPHAYTLSKLQDEGDHEAGVEREKQLLYVSITRARDEVFVTWVGRGSRFLKTQQGSTLETTE